MIGVWYAAVAIWIRRRIRTKGYTTGATTAPERAGLRRARGLYLGRQGRFLALVDGTGWEQRKPVR